MENYLAWSLAVLSGAMIVLVIIFSLVLYQIGRAVKNIASLTETLNGALPEMLANLSSITARINETITTVQREVNDFSSVLEKIKAMANFLGTVQQLVFAPLARPVLRLGRLLSTLGGLVRLFSRERWGEAKK